MAYKNLKIKLRQKHGSKCMLCGRKLQLKETTLHHIVPLSKGGKTTEENSSIICQPCQTIIHLFSYEEEGYQKLTKRILKNKRGE